MNIATEAAKPVSSRFQRPPWSRRWLWFALAVLILVADYLCGPVLLFPIFFILPVTLAAWNCARREAVFIATFLTIARLGVTLFRDSQAFIGADLVNGLIRAVVLVALAVLVSRVAEQNAQLARQVKQLEGLIAICAHCKRILDEEKHWTRLETYIVEHSQADFTHGICPDCARTHYGLTTPDDGTF